MMDASDSGYVSPFETPVFALPSADLSGLLAIAFLITFTIWILYTVTVSYHWLRYGHRSLIAVPAIGLHLIVSGIFIIYMATAIA